METSLLNQGLTLMIVGMGTVFVFLTLLVIAMSSMSAIALRFRAESTDAGVGASDEEVAAISAALSQHRKSR